MLNGPLIGFRQHFSRKHFTFGTFAVSVLLFSVADGIFSYQIPLWLETITHDIALVGLVVSSSSVVGFLCDLVFPSVFARRSYRFFLIISFLVAMITQLVGLVAANWFGAIAAMALWGVYYELFLFGLYHFLHTEIEPAQHASGWGVTESLRSLGLVLAPVFASTLLVIDASPFVYSGSFLALALALNVLAFRWLRRRKSNRVVDPDKKPFSVATAQIWGAFLHAIWPVYIFFFCVIVLDAAIWTVGVFFAEELRSVSPIGAFLIPAYYAPLLVAPLFAGKLARKFGKKHTAFFASIPLSLLFLIGHWFEHSALWHVFIMLGAGVFAAFIVTESEAIFEDYVARLHRFSGEMVGLVRSASNLGYIVGPLLAGLVAEGLGSGRTLAIIGVLPGITGLIAFFKMRGKTRLPQQRLEQLAQSQSSV